MSRVKLDAGGKTGRCLVPGFHMHGWVCLCQAVCISSSVPALLPAVARRVLAAFLQMYLPSLYSSSWVISFLDLIKLPPCLQEVSRSFALSIDGHS